jgi:adenylate cyclase
MTTGLVAAGEYLLLALLLVPLPAADPMGLPVYHVGRGVFIALTGLASGFVAAQIRRQVVALVQTVEERGRLLTVFGQQVSPPIARELTRSREGPASQKRYVAVMFLDIRNFTQFATRRSPEDVVAYQNAIFGFMLEIVARHHGIVNQLLGDGFMATFGAPVDVGNSSVNAVAAGREILAALRDRIAQGHVEPTRVGIGVHAGEAIVGNVGTAQRKQYSVTGTVVILAARIEAANKELGSQFLISEQVWNDLENRADGGEAVGPVALKGNEEPMLLYRLA